MDIGLNRKEVSTALIFGIVFVLLGVGVFFLTWQNLRQQEEHVREHLQLSAKSIGRGIEANLYRGAMRGMGGRRWMDEQDFVPAAEDLLQDLIQEEDVVFFGLYDSAGNLFFSSQEIKPVDFEPDPEMLEAAAREGWAGEMTLGEESVFVQGIPSQRMARGMGMMSPRHQFREDPGVIFIALDMSGHLEAYSGFKNTIILQTAFTLAAILIMGSLIWAYLRKRQQGEQFVRLRNFHSRLLDNMPDGLVTVNRKLEITAANPAAKSLIGKGEDILGDRLSNYLALEMDLDQDTEWAQVELGDKSLEVFSLPIQEEQEYLVLLRDRTRMKELENDVERSRRLAAVGRFAAGLAHEIRNPLSSLKGFAQYFQHKFARQEPEASYSRTMAAEADRLNRVVNDLLYLARPRELQPTQVNLDELFSQIHNLLQMDLETKGASLVLDAQGIQVKADADLLKQALINLVLNSLQAVPGDTGEISLLARKEGKEVRMEVVDNGCGMDETTLSQVWEPFFSTRDKGSGLGLSIVQRIARDHRGRISIDSAPGDGTRVSLHIPGCIDKASGAWDGEHDRDEKSG